MAEALKFECEIRQVKTMVDRSVNVTINLPEYHMREAAILMEHINELAGIAIVLIDPDSRSESGGKRQ